MQIIFLLIGIIGLVMFVFGIKTLIKNYRNEIISELKLTENEINFQKIFHLTWIFAFYRCTESL